MSSETAILIALGVALIVLATGYGLVSGAVDISGGVIGNYSDKIDTDASSETELSSNTDLRKYEITSYNNGEVIVPG